MHDLRAELAALVADVAEAFEGLRGQGVRFVPRESEAFVPRVEPEAARPAPPRPAPPARPAPRVEAPAPPPGVAAPPPPPRAAAPPPPARAAPAPPPPPAPLAGGGLLDRWADKLAGPAERLRRAQEKLGSACPGCGELPQLATGGLTSGMAMLYDAGTDTDAATLTNMLVRVVGVEPADVLTFHPRACATCAVGVQAQIEAARPRVVLALGPNARALLAAEPGRWARFAGVDAIGTWHPSEQGSDIARKRAAFEALKQVASRR